uniref:Uncharacterized protein n=1 Tax=Arundo donax TaxID=35708 RepID=A0A0A9GPY1_ARUDO
MFCQDHYQPLSASVPQLI